jgi:hypothetical protein
MARTTSGATQPAVTWTGLKELEQQLAQSAELLAEAQGILRESAEAAQVEIVAAYPRVTGNLRRGVKILRSRDPGLAGVDLKQTAPHGHLYEYGTVPRETKGKKTMPAGIPRGLMQPHPTFGPIAAQHQVRAITAILARIKAYGATSIEGEHEYAQSLSASSRLL